MMKLQYYAIVWSVIVTGTLATLLDRKVRMVCGGTRVKITDVPEQISLQYDSRHSCGGAIISENWVLTAAHCMGREGRYKVRAGSSYHNRGGSLHAVVGEVIYDKYVPRRGVQHGYNDIALVRVYPPFVIDETRQPIQLPKHGEPILNNLWGAVSGWGFLGDGTKPVDLHRAYVNLMTRSTCEFFRGKLEIGQFCAGAPEGGVGSCKGDSGSPLIVQGYLIGIVSWGTRYGNTKPAVYVDVAHFRQWIEHYAKV